MKKTNRKDLEKRLAKLNKEIAQEPEFTKRWTFLAATINSYNKELGRPAPFEKRIKMAADLANKREENKKNSEEKEFEALEIAEEIGANIAEVGEQIERIHYDPEGITQQDLEKLQRIKEHTEFMKRLASEIIERMEATC